MKTVVLLSGGMDSATLAYYAQSLGHEVYPLSITYGQRHAREVRAAEDLSSQWAWPFRHVDLSALAPLFAGSGSALTNAAVAVPDGHYAEESMRATVVPNRNMILLSAATAYAISIGAERVAYAAHAGDHTIYRDCRPAFVDAMVDVIDICDENPPTLWTPFIDVSKADIVHLGAALADPVPYGLTWSCLAKGTAVSTLSGVRPIETILSGDWVWGWDNDGGWTPSRVEAFMPQGAKEVFEVVLDDKTGRLSSFKATADHLLMMRDGSYVRVDQLGRGDVLMPASISTLRPGKNNKSLAYHAVHPHNDWREPLQYLHRIAADFFGIEGEVIHHLGDRQDNRPEMLEGMSRGDHTTRELIGTHNTPESNLRRALAMKQHWAALSNDELADRRRAISEGRERQLNHRIVSVTSAGVDETFDIQTTTENFAIGAGIFVHNCYKGGDVHCGTCGTDVERKEAFRLAGVVDPTEYEDDTDAYRGSLVGSASRPALCRLERLNASRSLSP